MKALNLPEDELRNLYRKKQWTQKQLADKYGCSKATVRSYLLKYGIELRSRSLGQRIRNRDPKKRNQGNPGFLNPNYKHGGYTLERIYREMVKIESCNRCGSEDKLVVHHRNDDHYDNRKDNLEVLCRSCHHSHHMKKRWAQVRELASD